MGDELLVFLCFLLVLSDPDASSPESLTGDSEPLLELLASSGLGVAAGGWGAIGDVRNDCRLSASSIRKNAVTAVQPE